MSSLDIMEDAMQEESGRDKLITLEDRLPGKGFTQITLTGNSHVVS